jgi:hypothetical protein
MDEQSAVVIRDEAGTEHEFPPGFDPQRAAEIVRQQAVPRDARGRPLVSSDTSDSPPSTLDQLNAMLGPLAHPQTLTDFARLLTLPVDSVRKALAGALTAAAARPAAGTALSVTGRGLERAGMAVEGPAKMATAYEMVTDPKRAVLTLATPKALQLAGRALQRVGTAVTGEVAPAAGESAAVAEPVVAAGPPPVSPSGAGVNTSPVAAAPVAPAPQAGPAPPPASAAPVAGLRPTPDSAAIAAALPDQRALNEAALAARRAAYQASQAAPAADPVVPASGKMRLTLPEFKDFQRLIQRGMSLPDAERVVKLARDLGADPPPVAATTFPKMTRGR